MPRPCQSQRWERRICPAAQDVGNIDYKCDEVSNGRRRSVMMWTTIKIRNRRQESKLRKLKWEYREDDVVKREEIGDVEMWKMRRNGKGHGTEEVTKR
jgi:hypothetical protein